MTATSQDRALDSKIINKSECFACKLFSVPLFYAFATYHMHKSFQFYKTERHNMKWLDKVGVVFVPCLLIVGGSVNMYHAWRIFQGYREDKELLGVLQSEGVILDALTLEEK